jgi:hypothetical protein
MEPFFCILRVFLSAPVPSADPGATFEKPLVGYYRRVGVAAENPDAAKNKLENAVPDGRIDWGKSEFLSLEKLEAEIARLYDINKGKDYWYMSGRIFFQSEAT